jgi:hypothetical protein
MIRYLDPEQFVLDSHSLMGQRPKLLVFSLQPDMLRSATTYHGCGCMAAQHAGDSHFHDMQDQPLNVDRILTNYNTNNIDAIQSKKEPKR